MGDLKIDLRSDTVTRPDKGMLDAMYSAPLGDDVFKDDPSVNALQSKVAAYFGMDAALFFPSGTMANQVAIKAHTQPGDELICDETAHVYKYEGGGIAANSGVSVRLLKADRGIFSGKDVLENINSEDAHFPITRLVALENTVNRGGGACWPAAKLVDVCDTAHAAGLMTHMDGARLWNALIETGQDPKFYGQKFDSISVCFSKGMGCPVGSVLLASHAFIHKAHRLRKRFGGGMRQIGGLAAACTYALDCNFVKLRLDHAKANWIAEILSNSNWVTEMMPVETNIIYFKVENELKAAAVLAILNEKDILASGVGPAWIRFVFHLDISQEMVERIADILNKID